MHKLLLKKTIEMVGAIILNIKKGNMNHTLADEPEADHIFEI